MKHDHLPRQVTPTVSRQTARALLDRIEKARTKEELETCEKQVHRHYLNGTLDHVALRNLDLEIFERLAKLES